MSQVVSFQSYRPAPRYDSLPWTDVRIEEGTTVDGPWVALETIPLSPVDSDPAVPAARSFTTQLASDTMDLWYRVVFLDADVDEAAPTAAVQNTAPASSAPYATATELARILKIREPSTEQTTAMERLLSTAAGEIDSEIDRTSQLTGWELDLAASVNLDRAADLWHHTESRTGLTGILGGEEVVSTPGRYSWERYAQRLAPLKQQFGLA